MPDWNDIVRKNAVSVLNAAYRILGNLSDAEDVSQEVFAEAFRKWDGKPDQQWAGVLKRMSVCRSIDSIRKKQKRASSLTPELLPDDSNNPLDIAISHEQEHRLRIAIGNLPPRESEVFCLTYFEQQSSNQIAELLGMSRPAVATALSKARSKLELVFREISTGDSK